MLHLVVNPAAHAEKGVMEEVERRLKARGTDYDVFVPSARGEIEPHVRELTRLPGQTVVAVGGDGTLNETVCGIEDVEGTLLGLIPAGTGNDFAASAKIPFGADALGLILDGEPKYTDYLDCGAYRSINIAGLGIDVDILERCERKEHGSEKGKYYSALVASLARFKALDMEVYIDGEKTECRALIAAACNGSQFGGGIPICPPAVLDDGYMDLVLIRCPARIKIPFELVRLMKGKILTRPIAKHVLCKEARIIPDRKGNAQYDGELHPADELSVRVVSGKLRMYRG